MFAYAPNASAQLYVASQYASPYVPLTGGTVLSFTSNDDAATSIAMPFTVSYYGGLFDHLNVGINGVAAFAQPCSSSVPCGPVSETCVANVCEAIYADYDPSSGLPNIDYPQNTVAPFWDDMLLDSSLSPVSTISYGTVGAAPNRELVVEWSNIRHFDIGFATNSRANFQVRIGEGGTIKLAYGAYHPDPADDALWSGIMGVENGDASDGVAPLPCAEGSSYCGSMDLEQLENQVIEFAVPDMPELTATLTAPTGGNAGDTLVVPVEVRNLGPHAAEVPFTVGVYLTNNTEIDPATDRLVGTAVVTSLDRQSTAQVNVIGVVDPATAPGYYVIGAYVDVTNTIAEIVETNNSAVASTLFLVGVDVSVTIDDVPEAGFGEPINFPIRLINQGGPLASVDWAVYLSHNTIYDAADLLIASGTSALDAVPETPVDVTAIIPETVLPGDYYLIARVDPNGAISEEDETNNEASTNAQTTLSGPDVAATSINGDHFVFRGEPYTVTFTLRNEGASSARDFYCSFHLSDNPLVTFADPMIGEVGPLTLGPRERRDLTVTYTISTTIPPGLYLLGVIADDRSSLVDGNLLNNVRFKREQVEVRDVAPDFTAEAIVLPEEGAAGESFPVERALVNAGNASGMLEYAIYLSLDEVFDPASDVELGLPNITLGARSEDQGADLVRIPESVPAGNYHVIYALDPGALVAELYEDNNVGVSRDTISVASAVLSIANRALPNATLNLPYNFVFAAQGGTGEYRWSVSTGALPGGLTLSTDGRLSGTPAEEGIFEFTVSLTDGILTVAGPFSLLVSERHTTLEVATRALIPAFVGRPYSYPLTPVGGVPPYSWSIDQELPAGLTFSSEGLLAGIAGEVALVTANFTVVDATGAEATRPLVVRVVRNDAAVRFTNEVLPDGTLGEMYDEDVRVEPGTGESPFVYSIASGALPPGLMLDENRVVGTPATVGTFPVGIRVVDNRGDSDLNLFILTVNPSEGITITTTSLPEGTVGANYKDEQLGTPIRIKAFSAGVDSPMITFELTAGAIPPGLTLEADGLLSGTPSTPGVYAFLVTAHDNVGQSDHRALGLVIEPAADPEPNTLVDEGCGCTTANPAGPSNSNTSDTRGSTALVFAALALLSGLRRKKTRALPILALLLLPSLAHAQVFGTYFMSTRSEPYLPRSGGSPILWFSNDDDQTVVPLPFAFKLYGQTYTEVSIGTNGIICFDPLVYLSTLADQIPDSFEPNMYIAAFWDDLVVGSGTTFVEGTAPTRRFVIQYENVGHYSATGMTSFQITLFEGPGGKVELAFGPTMGINATGWSASGGIEDDTGSTGFYFYPCANNCDGSQLVALENTVITVQQDGGEDVIPGAINAPPVVYSGVSFALDLSIISIHNGALGPFRYTVHLGGPNEENPNNPIFISEPITLTSFQTLTVNTTTAIPLDTPEGRYRLALEVDSADEIAEPEEANTMYSAEFRVAPPQPDFRVAEVWPSAATVAPGAMIDVTVALENAGNFEGSTDWALYLSKNTVISTNDLLLTSGSLDLPLLTTSSVTSSVQIPATVLPGEYRLGAVIDPLNAVRELSELNNVKASVDPLTVATDTVIVSSTTLPGAYVGVDYDTYLEARGGDGQRSWRVSSGSLPQGLTLIGSSGEIRGVPGAAGTTSFRVEVSSNGLTATADLSITTADVDAGLLILTRELLPGVVGSAYPPSEQKIAAAGSSGTITFALDGTAPEGLTLDPDGLLHGTPTTRGVFEVHVRATDGTATAARTLLLTIGDPGRLALVAAILPDGVIGEPYIYTLSAIGQSPNSTLTFSTQDPLPPGLLIEPSGQIAGLPEIAGAYQFTVTVVEGPDAVDAPRDTASFLVVIAQPAGFAITPSVLADAIAGTLYEVKFSAVGGEAPLRWRFEGGLPGGLESLVETRMDGRESLVIRGTPDGEGFATMLVTVDDAAGRHASVPLALRVLPEPMAPPPQVETGCGCALVAGPRGPGALDPERELWGNTAAFASMFALFAISRRRGHASR